MRGSRIDETTGTPITTPLTLSSIDDIQFMLKTGNTVSTEPKKTNEQNSSSLEELLIKRIDQTAHISIECISKEINFKLGSSDWFTDEIQEEIPTSFAILFAEH